MEDPKNKTRMFLGLRKWSFQRSFNKIHWSEYKCPFPKFWKLYHKFKFSRNQLFGDSQGIFLQKRHHKITFYAERYFLLDKKNHLNVFLGGNNGLFGFLFRYKDEENFLAFEISAKRNLRRVVRVFKGKKTVLFQLIDQNTFIFKEKE